MLAAGEAAVVAVSGGCDSMVLLDLLAGLARRTGWRLTIAHFNHRLRGRASDADERFVREAARRRGLPCVTGQGAVRAHARGQGVSLEMAARELRHAFLARCARAAGANKILLAHHADDQIETFFLRLARGAGARALAGMRWVAPSPADPDVCLLRPLLDTTRVELLDYARRRRIAFRRDTTNASLEPRRNVIRRRLLPWLGRHLQPAIGLTIRRIMTVVGDDAEVVDALARRWLEGRRRPAFAALAVAVQRQTVVLELRRLGIEPTFERVERLRLDPGRPVAVGRLARVFREPDGSLRCLGRGGNEGRPPQPESPISRRALPAEGKQPAVRARRQASAAGQPVPSHLLPVTRAARQGPGTTEFAGVRFQWLVRANGLRGPAKPASRPDRERFDADRVGADFTLRLWQPGDRFQPIGLPRAAKLQDLFTNAKVPQAERRQRVLGVTGRGEIFWVEGLRIGEQFKLTAATRRTLEWRWHRRGSDGSKRRQQGCRGKAAMLSSARS